MRRRGRSDRWRWRASTGGCCCRGWGRCRRAGWSASRGRRATGGGPSEVGCRPCGELRACTVRGTCVCWSGNGSRRCARTAPASGRSRVGWSGQRRRSAGNCAGDGDSCAVTTAGVAVCWGANGFGQLGDGTTTDRATPIPVVGLSFGVASVSAGPVHTCAVTTAGAAVCWGWNFYGQLGRPRRQRLTRRVRQCLSWRGSAGGHAVSPRGRPRRRGR